MNHLRYIFLVLFFGVGLCRAEVSDYSYVTSNGVVTITKYTGPGGDIIIPSEINGLPVAAIGALDTHEKRGPGVTVAPMEMSAAWLPESLRVFHPSEPITSINLPASLNTIGDFAFMDCREMMSCTIPDSVTVIGDYAFHACMQLKTLHLPNGVTHLGDRAISSCQQLTELQLGLNLTSIGDAAFAYCQSAASFHIPRTLSSLGEGAFAGCYSVTNISVDAENTFFTVKDGLLYDTSFERLFLCPGSLSLTTSSNVKSESYLAFSEYRHPESDPIFGPPLSYSSNIAFTVNLPQTLLSIEPWALDSCGRLLSVRLPEKIITIGAGSFQYCRDLTDLSLPSRVQTIGEYAFSECRGLKEITIPFSCRTLMANAFTRCDNLTNITVEAGNSSFSSHDGFLYNQNRTELILSLKSVSGDITLPSTVIKIGDDAFHLCRNLTGFHAESVEIIGKKAFRWCTELRRIELGENLRSIGEAAFQECWKLEEITIPQGVTRILTWAFQGCNSLENIRGAEAINYIGDQAFDRCSNLTNAPLAGRLSFIGNAAFRDCKRLISASIPAGVTNISPNAFANCTELRNVTIPDSVISIGSRAFIGCEMLRGVELPLNLSVIEPHSFRGCGSLTRISIPDGVTAIGKSAFEDCYRLKQVDLPDSVAHIAERAFASCGLQELELPSGVTSIEKESFERNEFRELCIPANVANIAERSFADCDIKTGIVEFAGDAPCIATNAFHHYQYGPPELHYWVGTDGWTNNYAGYKIVPRDLQHSDFIFRVENGEVIISCYIGTEEEIIIPARIFDLPVTKIESLSQGKSPVKQVTLPETILRIDHISFYPMLSHVEVAQNNPVYSSEDGMLFGKDKTRLIACPPAKTGAVSFPDTLRKLEGSSFSNCRNLTDIEIPTGIEVIPSGTFSSCTSLTNLVLPETVTEIGSGAFSACTNLMELALPAKVQHIGANAFSDCSNLQNMVIPGGVKTIEGYLFYECARLETVSIPEGVTRIGNQSFAGCVQLRELTLPKSVTNIIHWPFSRCESLTEVAIPDGVTDLSTAAFGDCNHLERIIFSPTHPTFSSLNGLWLNKDQTQLIHCPEGRIGEIFIPAGVTNVAQSAFSWRGRLSAISVDPANPTYASVDGVLYDKERTTLVRCPQNISGTICLPSTVTNITSRTHIKKSLEGIRADKENSLFSSYDGVLYNRDMTELIWCPKGKRGTIRIPASITNNLAGKLTRNDNITTIVVDPQNAAFSSVDGVLYNKDQTSLLLCPRAKTGTLHIPATVSSMGSSALSNSSALEAIKVSEGNKSYSSHEGVLLNKSQTLLIKCPLTKKGRYVLPNAVVRISRNAFFGCSGLTEIKLGPNVEAIRSFTFSGCTGLKRINIPESIEKIEEAAFANCSKNLKFILEGTPLVTIREDLFNTVIIMF